MHWKIHYRHPDGAQLPQECNILKAIIHGEGTHVEAFGGLTGPVFLWSTFPIPSIRTGNNRCW